MPGPSPHPVTDWQMRCKLHPQPSDAAHDQLPLRIPSPPNRPSQPLFFNRGGMLRQPTYLYCLVIGQQSHPSLRVLYCSARWRPPSRDTGGLRWADVGRKPGHGCPLTPTQSPQSALEQVALLWYQEMFYFSFFLQ